MLFFVDESFQTINGVKVGALGAVAIPEQFYNRFCGHIFWLKREILGVDGLADRELKGNNCFSKSLFRLQASGTEPELFQMVDGTLGALAKNKATVFARWTDDPDLLSLRNTDKTELTAPYQELLRDFAYAQRKDRGSKKGAINLDQLGNAEDLHAACTIQNFIARTTKGKYLQQHLLQIPNYTHSAVSPGLQMADLVAYLAAQQRFPDARPEIGPWWDRFASLGLERTSAKGGGKKTSIGPSTPPPSP